MSEAYFARLIGLPFIAVMPSCTARPQGGQIAFTAAAVTSSITPPDLRRLRTAGEELNGHYMDQFTYAERATDWRGNNNIADSIFRQMAREPFPVPKHIVMSAGTGGTSATLGRYIRYQGHDTQLTVVDPENSVFYDCFHHGDRTDRQLRQPYRRHRPPARRAVVHPVGGRQHAAGAGCRQRRYHSLAGRRVRPQGWRFHRHQRLGALQLAKQMRENGEQGAIVTLLCDSGERYLDTYYNPEWVSNNIGDLQPYLAQLADL